MVFTNRFSDAGSHLGQLRVATLNLWGHNGAWDERRAVLIDGFRALRPDLVALQKVIKNDEYDQAVDVLGPGWHIAHHADPEGMGISIASRWPLRDVQEVDLHVTARTRDDPFPCAALLVEVVVPELIDPLLLVNHFPSYQLGWEHERELQAVAVAQAIQECTRAKSLHVVLVGDFDADPEAASVRFWSGRQSLGGISVCYRDAWEKTHLGDPGHTFTPDNPLMDARDWPFRRIDYIFVRYGEHTGEPTLDILSCMRLFDEPIDGVWASQHFGLIADLAAPRCYEPDNK